MEKFKIISSFQLKMIAITAMLIDHLGAVIFVDESWMRIIGRLSFPIFCYLLVEGFEKTSDVKKYLFRLGVFAIISEVPFDLAFFGKVIYMDYQNVFFTLTLGLLVLIVIKYFPANAWAKPILIMAIMGMAGELHTDYGTPGILLILVIYILRKNKTLLAISIILINSILIARLPYWFDYTQDLAFYKRVFIQDYAVMAILPILMYNGKRGWTLKWSFYLFYPVHLLAIAIINLVILN